MKLLDRAKSNIRTAFGLHTEYDLSTYREIVEIINNKEKEVRCKSDKELQDEYIRIKNNSSLYTNEELLINVLSLVRQAAVRTIGLRAYDNQLITAIVLTQNKLAELPTGEGKTLSAAFAACYKIAFGRKVHVLTFNGYLAKRDAQWMGPLYDFFNISVGYIQQGMTLREKQDNYKKHIAYVTAKESGFDYLRDSLCRTESYKVHASFPDAVIDEADSIMIDEARIPLIIADRVEDMENELHAVNAVAEALQPNADFDFDEYARNIHLTDTGLSCAEEKLSVNNLYETVHADLLAQLTWSIHANHLLHKGKEYIVKDQQIVLIDEFTGRAAQNRKMPDGLQAALEVKENVPLQHRGRTINSITLQHFLQLYENISGMSATIQSAEREFHNFYGLTAVVVPSHKSNIRIDAQDIIFRTKHEKQKALIKRIISEYNNKRPVLVGTGSVSESNALAEDLMKHGITCNVLNAENDQAEAEIIKRAGDPGAVTISTNMAGRGTDIRLGINSRNDEKWVRKAGGLCVIGTNKHESARIDDQLRGRAGRQGDPGYSIFYLSLEDDIFKKYKLDCLLPITYDVLPDGRIHNTKFNSKINAVQRIIEGQNLEIKKTLFKYSNLLEKQRQIFFDLREHMYSRNALSDFFYMHCQGKSIALLNAVPREKIVIAQKKIFSYCANNIWSEYLTDLQSVREGIHFRGFAGQLPLFEFNKIIISRFSELKEELIARCTECFNNVRIENGEIVFSDEKITSPSATWTYLVNDNPWETMTGVKIIGDMSLSIGAGIWAPLYFFVYLFKKIIKK
jgi:preprotein translocase subunit SecA